MGQAFGVVGLEVMGRNVAQNIERNGFPVAVYNRTYAKTEEFMKGPAAGKNFKAGKTYQEFVQLLDKPRRVLLMVKAGRPTDAVIDEISPLLEPGDILIDGGNSLYSDTDRREAKLKPTGVKFFGMGVSGGEEGTLWGPAIMPGGDYESYQHLRPILEKIAAKAPTDGKPCVTYCGERSAGHFVKMVHNGIEYGDMQLIAEAYDLLRNVGGLSTAELKEVFAEWNASELQSFLIEIAMKVVDLPDPRGGGPLIDKIVDVVGMKGTGTWTIKAGNDLLVPVATMAAAVDMREMSMRKNEREAASKVLTGPTPGKTGNDARIERRGGKPNAQLVADVKAALYCSKICSYAQGMAMLAAANEPKDKGGFDYKMKLPELPMIWRAGCIIRATFLEDITQAFAKNPKLPNLLMDESFKKMINDRQESWRRVVKLGVDNGIGLPAFGASLAYYDSYRRARLPGNLIQAQRDYFGGHTYVRTDAKGVYHTDWAGSGEEFEVIEGQARTGAAEKK